MPKYKYLISNSEFFHCPKGQGGHRTMTKKSCHGLSIPHLINKTGIKEFDRYRWYKILGFFPRPARGKWYKQNNQEAEQ